MHPPVSAPGRRTRGLLLAVLLAAAQGSAWLHAALVAHVTCLEHGESIHAPVSTPAQTDGDPRDAGGADRVAASETTVGAHAHCAGGPLLRWRDLALSAPAASAVPAALSIAVPLSRAARADTTAAVYLLAPKTSPPSAAV